MLAAQKIETIPQKANVFVLNYTKCYDKKNLLLKKLTGSTIKNTKVDAKTFSI